MKKIFAKKISITVCAGIMTMAMITGCAKENKDTTASTTQANIADTTASASTEETTVVAELSVNPESDFKWTEEDGKIVITGYSGSSMDVVIPSTIEGKEVVAIDHHCFSNLDITSVVCPSTLKEIREQAFQNCHNLKNIQFNDGLEFIGKSAFGIAGLEKIILPDSVTFVDEIAFPCDFATEVKLSSSMTEISSGCFLQIDVTTFTVPSHIKTVGREAFAGCEVLETLIFEEGVEVLGDDVFENCDSLKSVVIPASVTEIGYISKNDCKNVVFTVTAGSYAETYLQEKKLNYVTQ